MVGGNPTEVQARYEDDGLTIFRGATPLLVSYLENEAPDKKPDEEGGSWVAHRPINHLGDQWQQRGPDHWEDGTVDFMLHQGGSS